MEWISVKDELPMLDDEDSCGTVIGALLYKGKHYIFPMEIINNKWHYLESGTETDHDFNVTHWMHLPQPPK